MAKSGVKFTNLDDIGPKIKAARRFKGLSQKELGYRIGVTATTIQKYEKGIIKDIPFKKLTDMLYELDLLDCIGIETGPADIEQLKILDELPRIIDKLFMDFGDNPHASVFNYRYLIVDLSEFPKDSIVKITNTVSEATNKVIADRLETQK